MAEKSKSEKKKQGKEEERVITIPLRQKADKSAKNKRMNRSVREIKLFLARHMSAELSSIFISQQLNESLWRSGFHKPPAVIKVKVSKDDEGNVHARLIDEREKPKKERKSRLGLRQRLARRKEESANEEKSADAEKKTAKTASAEKKKEPAAEEKEAAPKKTSPEDDVEQGILLEE